MTNAKTVEESVLNEKEKFMKIPGNSKTNSKKLANDASYEKKSNSKTRLIKNNEQNLKKTEAKLRSTRNKRNTVLNEKNAEKKHTSTSDDQNDSDQSNINASCNLIDNETCVKKKNSINSINKSVISPNHKLTEYFLDLSVHDHTNDVCKNKELKNKQSDDSDKLSSSNYDKVSLEISERTRKNKQSKVQANIESTNHKVTEYFQVRRSKRKFTKKIIDEKQKDLQIKIINEAEDGLMIKEFEDKGRGIVTTKEFQKGDFVIEYIGDLIDGFTAKSRETKYAKNKNIGCYMYYFKFNNQQYCIDATKESGKLGRLVNHSRKGNLLSKIIEINKTPHLVLFAKIDIPIGTEILYDYGDRNRESVQNHPWLAL